MSTFGPKSPNTRLALMALSLHMNPLGKSCFPSIRTICSETALSNRVVRLHLDKAVSTGWVLRFTRMKTGQGWRRYGYEAAFPEGIASNECCEADEEEGEYVADPP